MAALKKCRNKNVFAIVNKYSPVINARRHLNLQEYHSKDLLRKHQVSIQDFRVIDSSLDLKCISDFKVDEYVIKAQIPAGGRGKGQFDHGFKGGVHLTKKPEEILDIAKNMIGHKLVTNQTPKEGILVDKVMVAESVKIKRETYLSFMLDRTANGAVLVVSPSGGVDIETVAKNFPHLLKTIPIDIYEGVTDNIANEAAEFLQFAGPLRIKCVDEIKKLWQLFLQDATQLEINPFVETLDGHLVALDAKIEIDNYAFYRQKDLFALEDVSKIETRVREAAALNLVYVDMDGNVGCMSNGAGVCMSTIDLVALNGGRPANFMDLGGKIGPAEVFGALRILESDPKVKSVFINVFAGIVNCVTVAEGIIGACKETAPKHPIVMRLEGTNSEAARKILEESRVPLRIVNNADDAAKIAVELAQKAK